MPSANILHFRNYKLKRFGLSAVIADAKALKKASATATPQAASNRNDAFLADTLNGI